MLQRTRPSQQNLSQAKQSATGRARAMLGGPTHGQKAPQIVQVDFRKPPFRALSVLKAQSPEVATGSFREEGAVIKRPEVQVVRPRSRGPF